MRKAIAIGLVVWFAFFQAPAIFSSEFEAFKSDLGVGIKQQLENGRTVAKTEGGVKEKAYVLLNKLLPGLENRIEEKKASKAPGYQELKLLRYGSPEFAYEEGSVYSVVDGDTFYALVDGKKVKVRLIGVNTAECMGTHKDNPEPFSLEAKAYTESILTKDRLVYLVRDEQDQDKYGRSLRYVWLEKPDYRTAFSDLFNSMLLRDGCAERMAVEPNTRMDAYFKAVEMESKNAKVGIWAIQ